MANGCQDKECKQGLKDLKDYVYGPSAEDGGLAGMIKRTEAKAERRVPKVWLWLFVWVFALPLLGMGYKVFFASEASELKFETKQDAIVRYERLTEWCAQNATRSKLNEERFRAIKEDTDEIKKILREMNGDGTAR